MCDRCSLIDYPIGDTIWLPCGGPATRYPGRRSLSIGEDDVDVMERMGNLMKVIRHERARADAAENPRPKVKAKAAAFEGTE